MSHYDDHLGRAFPCAECDGHGGWAEQIPASIVAIEPSYRGVTCPGCEGTGGHDEAECSECYRVLDELAPATWHLCEGFAQPLCIDCARDPGFHRAGCEQSAEVAP